MIEIVRRREFPAIASFVDDDYLVAAPQYIRVTDRSGDRLVQIRTGIRFSLYFSHIADLGRMAKYIE